MKKLIYFIFTLALICVGNNYISAEEYASAKCIYKNNFHTYTYDVTSDGKVIDVKFSHEFAKCGGSVSGFGCYINNATSNVNPENFHDEKNNKITCPSFLYYDYSIDSTGRGASGTLNSKVDEPVKYVNDSSKSKQLLNLDSSSTNNNKTVTSAPRISCNYSNLNLKFDIVSDGKTYATNTGNLIVIGMDKVKPSDFMSTDGSLRCATYNVICYSDVTTKVCTIHDESSNIGSSSGDKNETANDIADKNDIINGGKYLYYLEQLKTPLSLISKSALNYSIKINNANKTLNSIDYGYDLCPDINCGDGKNKVFLAEKGIKDIANYCSDTYKKYAENKNTIRNERVDECIDFNRFYNELIKNDIINDISGSCPFITTDLGKKLQFVLDIIKIAAPILALALSTLDFVKTIAAGDADKESKTAFKRFGIRIGAAIMLFIIPVILAFLLDLFLENQDGYDGSNPFCDLVDLSDDK